MQILGQGLIARSLEPWANDAEDAIAFAVGVSDSAQGDSSAFGREVGLLEQTLEHCHAQGSRIVYFSSAGRIYGPIDEPRHEEMPCAPTDPYGRHKVHCESLIRSSPCRHLIVRLPNLVGPSQNPRQLVPRLVEQVVEGQVVLYQHAGRDLLGVDRMAAAVVELLANVGDQTTVVVASGITTPIESIVQVIEDVLQTRAIISHVAKGDRQEFRIDRFRQMAPRASQFSPTYPAETLRRYIPHLARPYGSGAWTGERK